MSTKLVLEIIGVIVVVVAFWFVGVHWKAHRVRAVNRFNGAMARLFGNRKQQTIWIIGILTLIGWGAIYLSASDDMRDQTPLDAWIDGVKKDGFEPEKGLPELIKEALPKSEEKPKAPPPDDGSPKAPVY